MGKFTDQWESQKKKINEAVGYFLKADRGEIDTPEIPPENLRRLLDLARGQIYLNLSERFDKLLTKMEKLVRILPHCKDMPEVSVSDIAEMQMSVLRELFKVSLVYGESVSELFSVTQDIPGWKEPVEFPAYDEEAVIQLHLLADMFEAQAQEKSLTGIETELSVQELRAWSQVYKVDFGKLMHYLGWEEGDQANDQIHGGRSN